MDGTHMTAEFGPLHRGAFYQVFVRVSSATSFEPISGKIDTPLGHHCLDSGENWRKFELFSFKIKIFTSKMTKNRQFSLVFHFFTQSCVL